MRRSLAVTITLALPVLLCVASTQILTIFVVQPLGAVPEGATVVIWRREKTRFIDSADAICQREAGRVNLLCRGAVLAGVAKGDFLLRLPYSETLYLFSTHGVTYDR